MIQKSLIYICNYVKQRYLLHVKRDAHLIMLRKWYHDNKSLNMRLGYPSGSETMRLDYSLSPQSIVLDIGGYRGDWAYSINQLYGSIIHVYEPVKAHFLLISERFKGCANVFVHNYGLGSSTYETSIGLNADGSSILRIGKLRTELVQILDIVTETERLNFGTIDLAKINIEGGEYDLLNRLLERGLIGKFCNLQVQFHNFFPDAKIKRENIRNKLRQTHYLTYDYPFIWENWRLKET